MTDFKSPQPGDPPWLVDAFAHLGTIEKPGAEHNEVILEMFAASGHPQVRDDETSWCAAFVNYLLVRQGLPGTGQLTARSFLDLGAQVAGRALRGDIVVIERGREAWMGHVFLYLAETAEHIWGIGGNQGKVGAVTVARFPKSKVLGIRRPAQRIGVEPVESVGRWPEAQVKAVQQRLVDLGYPMVGQVDGLYGRRTRAAILAFEADKGLELRGEPTAELLAALFDAEPVPEAPERAAAPPAEVRERVPEVKAGWLAQLWAGLSAIAALIVAAVQGIAEHIGPARQALAPIMALFGDVPGWVWGAAAAGLAALLWQQARRAVAAGVAAYRAGERR